MSDSVTPTVATACAPRCPTKKMSTTAKTDSISISRTIGMARSTMARLTGASVKSCCDPWMASLTVVQSDRADDGVDSAVVTVGCTEFHDPFSTGLDGSALHSDQEPG